MTAMSISQDTAATDSDRADVEEEEDEGSSKSSGEILYSCSSLPISVLHPE